MASIEKKAAGTTKGHLALLLSALLKSIDSSYRLANSPSRVPKNGPCLRSVRPPHCDRHSLGHPSICRLDFHARRESSRGSSSPGRSAYFRRQTSLSTLQRNRARKTIRKKIRIPPRTEQVRILLFGLRLRFHSTRLLMGIAFPRIVLSRAWARASCPTSKISPRLTSWF